MSIGDAISVGSTIYGILSPPIFRQCGYILFCNSHVSDLKSEIQKLKDAAARVQHSVDESRSAGEFIHEDVLTWLNNADQRIEAGNRILEINKVGRVLGCVPDPKACHKLGRDAKKAIPDFQKLFSEGVFDKVSYQRIDEQSLIVGASTSSQRNYVALKSRNAVLKFVMETLDDDKIGAIGVYGMGGVGKTTLLKEVENGAKDSKKFDAILSVFVSQAPNMTAIRAEIDYRLKRLVNSDASRKTVLILFDDLWKPLDLKDLGVPESNNKLKVKLVMTSRNKHLLADEMSCQRTFSIGVLDVEEAWRFFAVLVSSKIQDLKGKPAAVAFLKKCAGLPVSIEALATLWKKKKMDSSSGELNEDYLKQAKESQDGFLSLELSYNSVEDGDEENQAKLVFRIIGLLNSPKVPVLTLIKYMVGLGLFGSSTSYNIVERARVEITRSLRTLQESSLLLESDDSDHVKIHDVVRDVAVGIASREDHALIFDPLKNGNEWQVEKLNECKAASLTSSAVMELYERWNSPNLKILVLEAGAEQGDHHVELPEAKDMVKLRVMHLKNAQFTSLPSSINPDLKNLTTLCLDNCCLEDIAMIGKLVTLQVLSLIGSNLAKLPEEIGELINLRMLDLSKCSQLVFIESGILKRLTQLEELYLRESFDRWEIKGDIEGKDNASLEELNSMPRLRTLEVRIPDTRKLPQNLPLGDLVESKVLLGESWDWSGEYNESRTLKLEAKLDSMMAEEWFHSALQKTQDLHLEGLNETMESFHELCRDGFEELKHLHLQNSSSIKSIIWSTELLECDAFTVLESMVLENMEGLKNICNGCISFSSFSKLKVVKVQNCHELTSLFNISLLKNLAELEEIEINDCNMVQQIVIAEHINDDVNTTGHEEQNVATSGRSNILFGRPAKRPINTEVGGAGYEIKLLGNLRYLTLRSLPEITSFFTLQGPSDVAAVFINDQKVLQHSKYKEIRSITRLELGKLQRIELTDCKNVVRFADSQVLLKLINLESLTIEGCESLEDMFDLQGIHPDVEILPKLYELKLRELPKLQQIWKKNPNQPIKGCRKLRTVEIYKCDNLLCLSSSFLCEVMENLTEINISSCQKMETIFLEEEGPGSNVSPVKAPLASLKMLMILNCLNLKAFLSGNCPTISSGTSTPPSGLNGDFSEIKCSKKAMTCWFYGTKAMEDTSNLQVDTSNSFFNQKVFLPSLEYLMLSRAGEFEKLWCGAIPDQSYCKLDYVCLDRCGNLRTVFPASLIERLHNLKQLKVERCDKLETVFGMDVGWKSKKNPKVLLLPRLQEMNLEILCNLRDIIERDSDDEFVIGLPSLSLLTVNACGELINLIPTTTASTLLKLKNLGINNCGKLQKVISGEVSERYKRNVITFPHLTSMVLHRLNSLTCFSSESYRFDFMCLKSLQIISCGSLNTLIEPTSDQGNTATRVLFNNEVQLPNLEYLIISDSVVQELWSNEPRKASSFCKLKFLQIEDCYQLKIMIPSFMVKRLQNLDSIHVSGCGSVQDIFMNNSSTQLTESAHEESIAESRQAPERLIINFANLSSLQLDFHIKLTNLWSGSYTLELPSLKNLKFYRTSGTAVQAIMEKVHLPNLEELKLDRLSIEITELWHNEPSVGSFSKLKNLEVEKCEGLVKIITPFMVKRLENLETLVVNKCNNLEIVCELKWLVDVQEDSESNQPACFPYFQSLASIHVGDCKCVKNLFSISEQHLDKYGETANSDKIVQLPQLTYIRLVDLPNFSHLFLVMQGQYVLELSLLKEFFLFEAGDKEVVTHKVTFPEKLEIQFSGMCNFFGSTSSVMSDIMKALQTNQVYIIGLLGYMGTDLAKRLEQIVVDKVNLFDKVVDCMGHVQIMEITLQREFGIVYGEVETHGRAERARKTLLSYIRNKRLLLVFTIIWDEDIFVTAGIPVDAPPKQLKIILISEQKERLLKMGAQLIIPVGNNIRDRWNIFAEELKDSQKENEDEDEKEENEEEICSFVAPTILLLNNIIKTMRVHQNNKDQIIIGILLRSTSYDCDYLLAELGGLLKKENMIDEAVQPDDNEVDTIQEEVKTALGITTSETVDDDENEAAAKCSNYQLVDKKRLLLVLNNLDEEVDLDVIIGISKIILVSDKIKVLQNMGAQHVFEIQSDQSSETKNYYFYRIQDGYLESEELVKLAEECGSEDLAKVLAKKLKNRGMNAWANAFRQLKESPYEYQERRKVIASF